MDSPARVGGWSGNRSRPGRLTGWSVGDVLVYSDTAVPLRRKGWRRWLGVGHPEPHRKEIPE
jgi:hypothetical protein